MALEVDGRATASGDAGKVRQVLTNLVGNAIEACGDAGRIVILIGQQAPKTVSVEVHDTPEPAGSGLGLAISRAIARAHGGDIIVASTTALGSIFRLTLPTSGLWIASASVRPRRPRRQAIQARSFREPGQAQAS